MIALNIEDVITQLEVIIKNSEEENDRLGYFAALYHRVTCKVKDDIENNLFENGSRLAELDVYFANRYLFALNEWKLNKNSLLISQSWKIAFENASNSSYLVLHHLLLGMNAHINFDLGIAVVELAKQGNKIDELRRDYNSINNILGALTYSVINKLNIVSPILSILGFTGTNSNSMLVQFSLGNARDGAWLFARDLWDVADDDVKFNALILQRDFEIKNIGQLLIDSKGFLKFGILLIHLFEWKTVSKIVNVLYTHKKLFVSEIMNSDKHFSET